MTSFSYIIFLFNLYLFVSLTILKLIHSAPLDNLQHESKVIDLWRSQKGFYIISIEEDDSLIKEFHFKQKNGLMNEGVAPNDSSSPHLRQKRHSHPQQKILLRCFNSPRRRFGARKHICRMVPDANKHGKW